MSLEEESWCEMAKKIRVESLSTGREFCKSMITLCTGGIPVYLGLLNFVLPEFRSFGSWGGFMAIFPAFVFLASTVVFTYAYYPPLKKFANLDNYEDTVEYLRYLMRRRMKWTKIGLIIFMLGNTLGILVIATVLMRWYPF